jgi:hypothetical protein
MSNCYAYAAAGKGFACACLFNDPSYEEVHGKEACYSPGGPSAASVLARPIP